MLIDAAVLVLLVRQRRAPLNVHRPPRLLLQLPLVPLLSRERALLMFRSALGCISHFTPPVQRYLGRALTEVPV
jgi:hypothetical protein